MVSNLSCFPLERQCGKKMEAWSGAWIKGIFGWIIKKIAACWNATSSRLCSVARFKNKRAPSTSRRQCEQMKRKRRIKHCRLKWCQLRAQDSELPCVTVRGAESTLPFRDREIDFWRYNFNRKCLHYYKLSTSLSIYLLCTISKLVCPLLYTGNDAFNGTLQNSFVIHASEHVHCQCCITCKQNSLISGDGNITSIQGQSGSHWYE